MRKSFIKALTEITRKDPTIMALVGDLGFGVFDDFQKNFPEQYINVGVAEQNMTGLAAGMASEGYKVLTYSIANFNTLRCLEQIRNDICYHNLNVNIVSVGAGFAYGSAGYTHYAIEDIAVLKSLPNLEIYAPATIQEVEMLTQHMFTNPKPSYMRIGTKGLDMPHLNYKLDTITKLKDGSDVLILSLGDIAEQALNASVQLEIEGISVAVYNIHTLKPLDREKLLQEIKHFPQIVTVEEHVSGGLGSYIAEIIIESPFNPVFSSLCIPHTAYEVAAKQEVLRAYFQIDTNSIVKTILENRP